MGMMKQAAMQAPEQEEVTPPEKPEAPDVPGADARMSPVEMEKPEVQKPEAPEADAREDEDAEEGDIATPEEQAEYERGLAGIYNALYKNERASQAVVDMVQPEDKVGSTVKAVILLVTQVDKKLQLDEVVIPQLTEDAVDRVMELAEASKKIQYSDKEQQAVLGAAFEGVLQVFGDAESAQDYMTSMPPEKLNQHKAQYEQMLAASGPDQGLTAPQSQEVPTDG